MKDFGRKKEQLRNLNVSIKRLLTFKASRVFHYVWRKSFLISLRKERKSLKRTSTFSTFTKYFRNIIAFFLAWTKIFHQQFMAAKVTKIWILHRLSPIMHLRTQIGLHQIWIYLRLPLLKLPLMMWLNPAPEDSTF